MLSYDKLRKNQLDAINTSINNDFESGIHYHATGAGKSWIAMYILQEFNQKYPKSNVLWICERKDILIQQFSKEVLKNTLNKDEEFRGKEDNLNNHLIEFLDWKEDWKDKSKLKGFKFLSDKPENYSYLEDSIFNCIYDYLIKQISVSSEEGGVVNVKVVLGNDSLARLINLNWVKEMISFFKDKSSASLLLDIKFQALSIDSLQKIITENEIALTRLKDEHNAIVKAKAYLNEIRLKRKIEINTVLLSEMIKNHEMSKYAYMTQKPIVEIIESPRLPLKNIKTSLSFYAIMGILGGLFLSFLLFIIFPYFNVNFYNKIKS